MDAEDFRSSAEAWTHNAERVADAAQVANMLASTWGGIDAALRPIIGVRGVAALYKRSVYLTVPAHPWLAETYERSGEALDIASLRAVLAQQSHTHATSAGGMLLQTFQQLLVSLIGDSLAQRLLRPVWERSMGYPPEQESRS